MLLYYMHIMTLILWWTWLFLTIHRCYRFQYTNVLHIILFFIQYVFIDIYKEMLKRCPRLGHPYHWHWIWYHATQIHRKEAPQWLTQFLLILQEKKNDFTRGIQKETGWCCLVVTSMVVLVIFCQNIQARWF